VLYNCLHSKFSELLDLLGACTVVQGCSTAGCGVPLVWDLVCKMYRARLCTQAGHLCRISTIPVVLTELQEPETLSASKQNKDKKKKENKINLTLVQIQKLLP